LIVCLDGEKSCVWPRRMTLRSTWMFSESQAAFAGPFKNQVQCVSYVEHHLHRQASADEQEKPR